MPSGPGVGCSPAVARASILRGWPACTSLPWWPASPRSDVQLLQDSSVRRSWSAHPPRPSLPRRAQCWEQ
eukprot:4415132-Lingulodinium_polyedra.AAC.1